MLQREKEAEHFKTWAEQEDNFHLHQAKLRLVHIKYFPFGSIYVLCHKVFPLRNDSRLLQQYLNTCTHCPTTLCVLRSKIRIRDGRAKPIDLLAKYISAEDDDLAVEMHEPYTFLNGLTVTDMDDLLEDIKVRSHVTFKYKRCMTAAQCTFLFIGEMW